MDTAHSSSSSTPHKHVHNTEQIVEHMEKEAGELQEEPLSPSSRLFHEPHFNCYIVALMGSGKRIDVDVVKAGLEVTLLRHPRFSSVQVLDGGKGRGKARWVRTRVRVDEHLIVPELGPSAIESPDLFVEEYMSSLSGSAPLDMSKPLWELHILNVRTSDAEATAIFRIHHSLGDGASLVSLLLACTRKTSDPSALPSLPDPPRYRPLSSTKGRRGGFLLWLLLLARVAWNTLVDVSAFLATAVFLRDSETPIKGGEGCEFHRKRFVRRAFSLDDLKAVKRSMKDVTLNDVLLGVFSAGLSRYLFRRSGAANGNTSCFGDGKGIRLRSALLINTRKTPGIHAFADMMESANVGTNWGNHLGYALLPFPIAKHDNPLYYVMEAKKIVDRKKASLEAYFSFSCGRLALNLFGMKALLNPKCQQAMEDEIYALLSPCNQDLRGLPQGAAVVGCKWVFIVKYNPNCTAARYKACLTAGAITHRVLSGTTLSFSNVIGPMEEIGFYNHPMVYLAPTVYGHPHALTVHFLSYMGKMMMVLAVDESVIPDPHQLCEDILESLSLIKAAARV